MHVCWIIRAPCAFYVHRLRYEIVVPSRSKRTRQLTAHPGRYGCAMCDTLLRCGTPPTHTRDRRLFLFVLLPDTIHIVYAANINAGREAHLVILKRSQRTYIGRQASFPCKHPNTHIWSGTHTVCMLRSEHSY